MHSRPPRLWPTRAAFYEDAVIFGMILSSLFSLGLMGSLPGSEVLLAALLPAMLALRWQRAFKRENLWFLIWVAAWLFGTVASDIANNSFFLARAKGTARVVFFALDFLALAVLINNKVRRIIVFSVAYAAVLIIGSLNAGEFALEWKFGLSQGLGTLAMLLSSFYFVKRRYGICLLISLAMSILNLRYGFRSQLAIQFVSAALVLPLLGKPKTTRAGTASAQSPARLVLTLVLVGAAAYAANTAIKYAAKSGIFDDSTTAKFESQDKGDYGVLVGGRPETLVAIQAIIDRPIVGHGSFAEGEKYLWMKQRLQYEHGYSDTDVPDTAEYDTIPTHSHLTLAWVEGGILGGICWIYIFALVVRALLKLPFLRPDLAPLYSYALTSFLWDILYSPFGSTNRVWAAFYVLVCYLILNDASAKALALRRQAKRQVQTFYGQKPLPRRLVPTVSYPTELPGS